MISPLLTEEKVHIITLFLRLNNFHHSQRSEKNYNTYKILTVFDQVYVLRSLLLSIELVDPSQKIIGWETAMSRLIVAASCDVNRDLFFFT